VPVSGKVKGLNYPPKKRHFGNEKRLETKFRLASHEMTRLTEKPVAELTGNKS
jgi:hypothetical protein